MRRVTPIVLAILSLASSACIPDDSAAQTLAYAEDLYAHGLNDDASRAFLSILHEEGSSGSAKSEALYFLGQIAFDDGKFEVAMNDWLRLIESYPSSERAQEISGRLDQLRDVVGDFADASLTSAIARSYVRNGDFWSKAGERFLIDSSWLPSVELAIEWYDQVIDEFPGTPSAELAYRKKLLSLGGWVEPGQYGSSYGVREDFDLYMPQLVGAFEDFLRAFPDSRYLDGFRYQIAQAYWRERRWADTEAWLNRIIESSDGSATFYTQLARARLAKLTY